MIDTKELQKYYDEYLSKKTIYDKMYEYYKGNTDAMKNYKMITDRANNKINTNFMKKFVKEEMAYSVGNPITYISKTSNTKIIDDISYYTGHWSENHDSDLMKAMLIHSVAYELYYIDKDTEEFSSRIISPRNGYAVTDDYGKVLLFMHIFTQKYDDTKIFIDIHTDTEVIHCDDAFKTLSTDTHIFGVVPVGIAQISPELEDDTIYKDIKGLQDSLEVNLSDISNEISDFRNAYLAFTGVDIEETDLPKMKEQGIIAIPVADGKVEWIIKNINDSFIQNTLNTVEGKMYQITSHINNNEAMQSNTSSLAIRARLISLEQKCRLNDGALKNCIKTRLKMLFIFLKFSQGTEYDYKDIKSKFTPCIPSDDTANANIISQVGDVISKETSRSLFSFIDNPINEGKKVDKENKANSIGNDLLNPTVAATNTVVTK